MISQPVPLILGHNPLIGVDHLSQQRARDREQQFAEMSRLVELVRDSIRTGVRGLMVSTHSRVREILPQLAADEEIRSSLRLYPIIPYAADYVRKSNQSGLTSTIVEAVRAAGATSRVSMAARAALAGITRSPFGPLGSLVDAELLAFRGLNVDAVFLHNVLTDLLLGWRSGNVLAFFSRYVERKHGIRAGFVTMNYPTLTQTLVDHGVQRPLVLASFNSIGFQMNPSREACEAELGIERSDVIAMSILASGLLSPRDAAKYINQFPAIRSVVFGASTADHIRETSRLLLSPAAAS